jgi:hypothetical protein
MLETIEPKSLMRISKFAKLIDKSPAWVKKLGEQNKIDIIEIDGYLLVRINEKFRNFVKYFFLYK